jgi:hypothetical protein
MVNVPIYGAAEGVPFPCFDRELPADEDKSTFAAMVEEGAGHIVGKISDREYLTRKVAGGMAP